MAMNINFRLCRPDEGSGIAAFLARCAADPNVELHDVEPDWSGNVDSWLLATDETDNIIGCVAFAAAKPVGFAECMSIAPEVTGIQRTRIVCRLTSLVQIILKERGVSALVCLIPDGHSTWRDALIERGAKVASRGAILVRGL